MVGRGRRGAYGRPMPASTRLHVNERSASDSAAPTVVIVHGAMDRSTSFGRVDRQLTDRTVIRYDRRGYGRSAGVGVGTLDDHVDDLLAVIDGRSVTVFGHSIGGVVALIAAQRAPEQVRSVLAYEAPAPWSSWWPSSSSEQKADPADEAEAFMRRAIGDRLWARLGSRTRSERRSEGMALLADLASLHGIAPYEPAQIAVPVLSAAGSETSWWHQRASRELAAAVPSGELVMVAGAHHGVHLSHPGAAAHLVNQAITSATNVEDS